MGDTVHVKTKTGLEIDVDDTAGQDAELLAAALSVHAGDALGFPRLLRHLLTAQARAALYDHVRRAGRVPYDALVDATVDILGQLPGKRKIIALAGMLAANEDALVCDLAETYRIMDWRALPVRTVATLAVGLSEIGGKSRIPVADVLCGVVDGIAQVSGPSFFHMGIAVVELPGLVSRGRKASVSQYLVGRVKTGEVTHLGQDHGGHAETYSWDSGNG